MEVNCSSDRAVLLGIIHSSRPCLALNHLIITVKYFSYVNVTSIKKYHFADYVSLVRDKLLLGKGICSNIRSERQIHQRVGHSYRSLALSSYFLYFHFFLD